MTPVRAQYPMHATQDTRNHPSLVPLRGYHALRRPVPGDFESQRPDVPGSTTPHLPSIAGGIRIALWPFPSPVLRPSRLVSFPPPTRMFYFGGFPYALRILAVASRIPIRGSADRRLLATPRSISQLGTLFVGARAEPSTSRRNSRQAVATLTGVQGCVCIDPHQPAPPACPGAAYGLGRFATEPGDSVGACGVVSSARV